MSNKTDEELQVKRMAALLRQGAILTNLACPACASPLLRLKDSGLWCAKCEKKVIIVKEGDEARLSSTLALEKLEATLLTKLQEVQIQMQNEQNPDELQKLGTTLNGLLENLEKTRKAKKS